MVTVSRYSSSGAPVNQGVSWLRSTTLSPFSAERNRVQGRSGRQVREAVLNRLEDPAIEADEIHLVDGEDEVRDAQQPGDPGMAPGLFAHAVPGVDQENRQIRGRSPGRHVPRVLLVPGRVGEDELPARGREVR